MKDGDRITGDIVKKDGDDVTVKSKNFGTVTLKWSDIASIRTETPVNVETSDGKTVKANIETQGDQIQITAPGATERIPPANIVALRDDAEQKNHERFLHPGLLDLWAIRGSFGIAGAQGNAETFTITTPVNFERVSNTTRTTAYFNSIRSRATVNGVSAQTARAVRGGWAYSRNLNKRVFANAFNDYEYDAFQSLDLRVVLGGGIGYQLWTRDANRLALLGGISWNHETFDPFPSPVFTRNSAEAYWGDDFTYKLNSRTNIVQAFRMFNNLSNTGAYRMNFDAGVNTQLTSWLNWTISVSDRYLSNPVPGRKNNDFLYTTSLGFQWSRQ
jgi:putative salt-induced outer membrane protein